MTITSIASRRPSVASLAKAALAVSASLLLAGTLAGCGQKGPLVLERPAGPASAASAAAR